MHAAPTAVLGSSGPGVIVDPLASFTKHRKHNRQIAMALHADFATSDVGRAIANCAGRIGLDIPIEGEHLGEPMLRSAMLCNRRLCPFCEWRRTRAWRARLIAGLNAFAADQPKWSGVFLTLTVRNCPVHELRQTVRHMHASVHRLTRTSIWPTQFYLRRTEITVSLCNGGLAPSQPKATTESVLPPGVGAVQSVHPHVHMLLLVRPSYWGREYIKQTEWQRQWQMAARLDYAPVVDVRRAKAKPTDEHLHGVAPVSAVIEAAKYVAKATDLQRLGSSLPLFHHEMKGLRLYGISKSLQRYVSAADVSDAELLDTEQFPAPAITPVVQAVAEWSDAAQEYSFVL